MNIAWKKWLAGLWAAGSSGAVTAISTSLVAPDQFNIYTKKFWICSSASALMSALKYIGRTTFFVGADGKLDPEVKDDQPQPKP